MLTLPLEPTDDRAAPAFKDAAACKAWLGQLQLTNLQQAQAKLHKQLDELNRYPMRGLERLHTLELLRETVSHVQTDYAKKLLAKALPLSDGELAVLTAISGLWQGMVTGYQRCLQAYIAGDQQLAAYGALLCHRCLGYSGQQILEQLRAGYEIDGQLWQQLHALYLFAEEQNLQLTEVEDELSAHELKSSCRTVYIKILLISHAHPAELSRGQLQLLERWLSQWGATLTLEQRYTKSKGDSPPLALDLDSTLGLQPLHQVKQQSGNLRYLAMVPMSKLLRVKTILLQQGQSPQQLELGSSINAADCAEFLKYLHQHWCEDHPQRMAERHNTTQEVQMCYGLEAIYAHVANKPFRAKSKGSSISDEARNQIATFGRVLSDTNRHDLATLGYIREGWLVEDESVLGARMLRHETDGMRLNPKQIIAIRSNEEAAACMLGVITWLTVTCSGQLQAGIHYLPGMPQAIAVKTTGINPASGGSAAALLLPAMPELRIPASLVIPRNLFQAGHKLEITFSGGEKKSVTMGISVAQGLDYERISFTDAKA
ncbi:MAG: hypothetical protein GC139_04255 [Sideroxydans sp.]|nr:hypothetical protein [Sideroxydans sp.]